MINRFIILIFGLFLLRPEQVKAQNHKNQYVIGISQWVKNEHFSKNIAGFKKSLTDHQYIEGKKIKYIIKNPQANHQNQHQIIEEFIQNDVDLIYSLTTPGTLIAKSLTKEIPIVFSIVTFPVETGLISSLQNSQNNLTGTRNYISPARQYFYFTQLFPNPHNIAFIHRKDEPNSDIQYQEFQKLMSKRKINLINIAATDLKDLKQKLDANNKLIDTTYAACDTLIQGGGEEIIIAFSKKYKKPNFTCNKDGVEKGALIGNVADFYEIGKLAGQKAALILSGTKPNNIPVTSPTKDFVILNVNTAKELDLKINDLLKEKVNKITNKKAQNDY